MKNFWLRFVIQEAIGILEAYVAVADPAISAEIQAALDALSALLLKLTGLNAKKV